jgi:sec-independent protein translocase protein TatA
MGEFSPIHWLIVLAIIVLLFGGKKIPEVMRGLGEGIRNFKEGMHMNQQNPPAPPNPAPPANPPTVTTAPPPLGEDKK